MEILLLLIILLLVLIPAFRNSFWWYKQHGFLLTELRCKNDNPPYVKGKTYPLKIWTSKYNTIEVEHISGGGGISYGSFEQFYNHWEPIHSEYKTFPRPSLPYVKYLKMKYPDKLTY